MSNVVVGSLSVDLVARTASFQGDLGKAAQSARGSFQDIRTSASAAGAGAESAGLSFGSMRAQIGLLDNALRGNLAGGFADITHVLQGLLPEVLSMAGPVAAVGGAIILLTGVIEHFTETSKEAKEAAAALKDEFKTMLEVSSKNVKGTEDLKKAYDLIGLDGIPKFQEQISQSNVLLKQQQDALRQNEDQIYGLTHGFVDLSTNGKTLAGALEELRTKDSTLRTAIDNTSQAIANQNKEMAVAIQRQKELSEKKLQAIRDALYFQSLEGKAGTVQFGGEGAGIIGSSNPLDDIARQTTQDNVVLAKQQDIVIGKVSEAYKAYERLGDQIGNTIEQAALFGRSWRDAISSILIDVAELILKMTLLKSIQSSLGATGVGGFFNGLLGGITGGSHADGGTIPPGTIGLTGEAGPELVYGGMTGVTVYPIAKSTTNTNGGTTIYNMDFRGASDDIQAKVQQAIAVSQRQSVAAAVNTMRDQQRRGAR
jgi:hypothetical protein